MIRKILLATLFAIVPAAAAAQTTVLTDVQIRSERAGVLAEQAIIIAKQGGDFRTAAGFLREAADLWGSDFASVDALMNAGRFHYYGNSKRAAMSALRQAAIVAERVGSPAKAARAWSDAAWVAAQVGETEIAVDYMTRSEQVLEKVAVVALGMAADN